MKVLLIFAIFSSFSKSNSADTTGLCTWQQGVNRKAMDKLNPMVGKSYTCELGKYTYTIAICQTAPGKEQFAAVTQTEDKEKPHSAGDMRSADLLAGSDWVMLYFYDGDQYGNHCGNQNRSSVVMVKCNTWAGDGRATAIEENTDKSDGKCHYLFEIETALICPPKKGLSAGSIFIIIFCVFVACYLIVGFLYQRCVAGAQGWEQVPNYHFWVKFGALQADGCNFLCRCDNQGDSKEYRSIDDALSASENQNQSVPRSQEIDDRLLS